MLHSDWAASDEQGRQLMLYGEFTGVVERVRATVPPGDSLLLFSDVDPALFPYALYPRKIYQVDVEPETNRMFMRPLADQEFTPRSRDSFGVAWILQVSPPLLPFGGNLQHHSDQARSSQ